MVRKGNDLFWDFETIFNDLFWKSIGQEFSSNKEGSKISTSIDLPGFKKDEVDIDLQHKRLVVSAKQTKERGGRSYYREFTMPFEPDLGSSSAVMEDGVLKLEFAKMPSETPQKLLVK